MIWGGLFIFVAQLMTRQAKLRREVERPASVEEAEGARNAAEALFEHFLHVVNSQAPVEVALAS